VNNERRREKNRRKAKGPLDGLTGIKRELRFLSGRDERALGPGAGRIGKAPFFVQGGGKSEKPGDKKKITAKIALMKSLFAG